jgi:hypothetical protein
MVALVVAAVTALRADPDPVAVNVPAERLKPEPTVISSTAPVAAVVRPSILAVDIVIPSVVMAPGAT